MRFRGQLTPAALALQPGHATIITGAEASAPAAGTTQSSMDTLHDTIDATWDEVLFGDPVCKRCLNRNRDRSCGRFHRSCTYACCICEAIFCILFAPGHKICSSCSLPSEA